MARACAEVTWLVIVPGVGGRGGEMELAWPSPWGSCHAGGGIQVPGLALLALGPAVLEGPAWGPRPLKREQELRGLGLVGVLGPSQEKYPCGCRCPQDGSRFASFIVCVRLYSSLLVDKY